LNNARQAVGARLVTMVSRGVKKVGGFVAGVGGG